jgi:uncharacterized delta-60 repeat protein
MNLKRLHFFLSRHGGHVVILLAALMWLPVTISHAAPGEPDPVFARIDSPLSYGKLLSTVGGGGLAEINAVAVQPDGKILVGGGCHHALTGGTHNGSSYERFCLQRYRAPLSTLTQSWLDVSFGTPGTAGTAIHPIFANQNAKLVSLSITPEGKILAAGNCSWVVQKPCMVRLLSNGTQDLSFAPTKSGVAEPNFPNFTDLIAMKLQADGRIVLLATCSTDSQAHFCLARYLITGELDASFGVNGLVETPTSETHFASALVIQNDGSIVVSGRCYMFDFRLCIRRYTATGAVDPNFALGTTGGPPTYTKKLPLPEYVTNVYSASRSYAGSMALTASGKLLIAVGCRYPTNSSLTFFCLTRLQANGDVDLSFGSSGILGFTYTSMNSDAFPTAISVQPDGKFIVAGTCTHATPDFCAARYLSEGQLDPSFDGDGIIGLLTAKPNAYLNAMALQPDGKAVLAGLCTDGGIKKFCIMRLEGGPYGYKNCTMDIDGDGRVLGPTDALIHARVASGLSGAAVMTGLAFAPNARRTTWPLIRDYLGNQCGMMVSP